MLNTLAERTHQAMVTQGFWDDYNTGGPHVPAKLALIHSEVSEALEEWRRSASHGLITYYTGDGKPEGFVIELADAIIRIADLAGFLGLDLEEAIAEKESYNMTRPFRHGKVL